MAKNSFKGGSAPKAAKIGGGLPGSSSRARINEAAGVKVKGEAAAPKAAGGVPQAPKASSTLAVTSSQTAATQSADSRPVMPAKHPGSKTTHRQGKAGWDD